MANRINCASGRVCFILCFFFWAGWMLLLLLLLLVTMKVNRGANMDFSCSPVPRGQLNTFLRWPCHCPHTRSTQCGRTAVSERRLPEQLATLPCTYNQLLVSRTVHSFTECNFAIAGFLAQGCSLAWIHFVEGLILGRLSRKRLGSSFPLPIRASFFLNPLDIATYLWATRRSERCIKRNLKR